MSKKVRMEVSLVFRNKQKKLKYFISSVSILIAVLLIHVQCVSQELSMSTEKNITDSAMVHAKVMLAKLTLEEKIALCHGNSTMTIAANSKIGLDKEFVMSDGPHTVRFDLARESFNRVFTPGEASTNLPTLSALAATFNQELAYLHGSVLGAECRDRGKDMLLGPGVNILRTPLNGRNYEYMGEDPFLASHMSVPVIKGIQAFDVAACIKHYAVNNQEWNRNGVNALCSERTLREIYLPAFEAAVREGEVLTVMNGYNLFRGEHCSHSAYLNRSILKEEWGFKGFVVTDWGSLHDAKKGVIGGLDVEMNAGKNIVHYPQNLLRLVRQGEIAEALIDEMALRVLYVMTKIEKITDVERAEGTRNTKEHQAIAQKIAEEAIVLLKNENDILPLKSEAVKQVLILGRNAIEEHCGLGWSAAGAPPYEVTPFQGLKNLLGEQVQIDYYPLVNQIKVVEPIPDHAILTEDHTARDMGMTIKAWKADYYGNDKLEGDIVASGFTRQLNFNWNEVKQPAGVKSNNFSVRYTAQIKVPKGGEYAFGMKAFNGAILYINGEKVLDKWKAFAEDIQTLRLSLEKDQILDIVIETRVFEPNRPFIFGWKEVGKRENEEEIIQLAKQADAVILMTGTQHGHGLAKENEGGDLPNMKQADGVDEAVAKYLKLNPTTVVVNLSGTPLEMPWVKEAPAIVQYWYSGQEGGNALARVLFGKVNPSGKLPMTFPKKLEDSPAHYLDAYTKDIADHEEGIFVGYRWYDKQQIEPMFPFGFGLSYTTFRIYDMQAPAVFEPGKPMEVLVKVENTGNVAGAEVIQLYINDKESSVERPYRELKGFKKVYLNPGESKEVSIKLNNRSFAYWDEALHAWKIEPGEFTIIAGNSSMKIDSVLDIKVNSEWSKKYINKD